MSDIKCTCGAEMDGYLDEETHRQMYRCPRCPGIEITETALFASAREKIDELEDKLAHIEFDRSYYTAILDGSWPSAAEVMAYHGWFRKEQEE